MINVDTDIDEIKTLHMGLFDELQDNAGYYRANQEARDAFVTRVRSLLSRIRERAGQPLEASQYYWMRDAIKAWQIAFAAILQVGEHVEALPGFQKTTVNKQLTASDITHMVDAYANRRYQERKEESREAELLRMQRTFFMSTEDEYKEDTFSATVWLASEFLFNEYDGIDLQGAPSKDLLEFLSRVWLHDVTRFRAFLHWEKTQRPAPGDAIANYFLVLNELRGKMSAKEKSISDSARQTVVGYLVTKYCANTESCKVNREALVKAAKAERSWYLARAKDADKDYYHALDYVNRFYDNVVPAILGRSDTAKDHLWAAFHISEGKNYFSSIVNCLEAAIMVYFVQGLRQLEDLQPGESRGRARDLL